MDDLHKKHDYAYSSVRPPGYFSCKEYADKYDLTLAGAERRLRHFVSIKKLETIWAIIDGKRCRVYRPA